MVKEDRQLKLVWMSKIIQINQSLNQPLTLMVLFNLEKTVHSIVTALTLSIVNLNAKLS